MENQHCYAVSFMIHNKTNDSWASRTTWTGTDERTAWENYGSEQARLMGSSDFDVVIVYILNESGYMDSKAWDERPAPIEVEEIEVEE